MLNETDLDDMQNEAIDWAFERDESILVIPVGGGKTISSLTCIAALLADNVCKRVLVVAPLRVCRETWAHEAGKWSHLHKLNIALALGGQKQRRAAIDSPANVVVINCENIPWLFNDYGRAHGFDGLVIDELTKFKAIGGAGAKALRKHRRDFGWFCGLTATPCEEHLMDMYGLMVITDGGARLGRNFERFRSLYFTQLDYAGYNWAAKAGAARDISAVLSDVIFTRGGAAYEAGLPDLITGLVHVELDEVTRAAYATMARGMLLGLEGDNYAEAVNAAVLSGKLRQLANGFVYDDAGGVEVFSNAKLEATVRTTDASKGSVIVCYEFRYQLEWLADHYGDKCVVLGRDDDAVSRFNSGDVGVLIMHPKSGGHGLNLQERCREIVLCGPIWSNDQYRQLIGRVRRRGQPSSFVLVHTVVGVDTVEESMIARVDDKAERAELIMRHLRGV